MTVTKLDTATGTLLVAGERVFPLGLSDPPPVDSQAPNGKPAWAEIASAGANFARNYTVWTSAGAGEQLIALGQELEAAQQHGLQMWVALAGLDHNLARQSLLDKIVNTVKPHPGLGVWKGADEPAHGHVPVAGLVAVRRHLKTLDPDHPLALIEAPRAPAPAHGAPDRPLTVSAVKPYAAACDIHGVDIYPVSKPAGMHAGGPPVNTDISVVGDMTRILARATARKAIWTTLQVAWSGVLPPHPLVFPTLPQARFMAYDAITAGARGLFFFGGQLPEAMNAQDRQRGWNWSYWNRVQRPLLRELSDPATHRRPHRPARTTPGHRQRRRHRRQHPRRRRHPLPDRGATKPDRAGQRPLQRPTRRHQQRHRPRPPRRKPSPTNHRQTRRLHRPRAIQTAQRTRLPLPRPRLTRKTWRR